MRYCLNLHLAVLLGLSLLKHSIQNSCQTCLLLRVQLQCKRLHKKHILLKKWALDAKQIVAVAVTPCTAKKFEIRRDEMNSSAEYWDVPEMRDTDLLYYYT